VLLWAVWFGMLAGTLELAAFVLKYRYLDPGNFNVSRHFPVMFPLAGVLVLSGPGVLLALAGRIWPRRVTAGIVLAGLSFPAYAGFFFRWPIYTAVCLLLAASLAFRTAGFLTSRIDSFNRLVRRSLVMLSALLAAVSALSFGAQSWSERSAMARLPAGPRRVPNVILIVLDTVRADSLGFSGSGRGTSPNLDRLAARGVRFDRAYATAPWTAPSHASMFTGRWSHELSVGWDRPLDETFPTLAEFLAARGYATAGFVANTTYCSSETGLSRGFAHYEDYDVSVREILLCSALVLRTLNFLDKHPALTAWMGDAPSWGEHRKSAARINRDFLRWLSRTRQKNPDRPFFAFLNYYDAHHPYLPPSCGPEGVEGGVDAASPPESQVRMLRSWWDLDKRTLGPRDVAAARAAYDRCITRLDRQIGRLVEDLERRGLLDETLVVVTADHGEHFGEQQLFGHGCSLYLPELHVPLLLVAPGSWPAGRVTAEPVSLRDLAATIVDTVGLGVGSPFPGRSLARTWSSDTGGPGSSAPSPPGVILSEIDAPPDADPNHGTSPVCRGPLKSLVDARFHYILRSDGQEELYDLGDDPHEVHNLAGAPEGAAASAIRRFRMIFHQGFASERIVSRSPFRYRR
jgi:arylsulfatase A-like enzyme